MRYVGNRLIPDGKAKTGWHMTVVMLLAVSDVGVVLPVEFPRGGDLFQARRDLDVLGAMQRAGPVLERHARVSQVRVLKSDHFVTCIKITENFFYLKKDL